MLSEKKETRKHLTTTPEETPEKEYTETEEQSETESEMSEEEELEQSYDEYIDLGQELRTHEFLYILSNMFKSLDNALGMHKSNLDDIAFADYIKADMFRLSGMIDALEDIEVQSIIAAYPNVGKIIASIKESKGEAFERINVDTLVEALKELKDIGYPNLPPDQIAKRLAKDVGREMMKIKGKPKKKPAKEKTFEQKEPQIAIEREEHSLVVQSRDKIQSVGYCMECIHKHVAAAKKLLEEAMDRYRAEGKVTEGVREKIEDAISELEGATHDIDITKIEDETMKEYLDWFSNEVRMLRKSIYNAGIPALKGDLKDIEGMYNKIIELRKTVWKKLEACPVCFVGAISMAQK